MSMTHTPGPWKAGVSEYKVYSVPRPEDDEIARVYGDTREEQRSNAALIAAAPELLEMLRKLQWFRDDDGTQICPSCNAYGNGFVDDIIRHKPDCKLSALLQKARGE